MIKNYIYSKLVPSQVLEKIVQNVYFTLVSQGDVLGATVRRRRFVVSMTSLCETDERKSAVGDALVGVKNGVSFRKGGNNCAE